ncbi:altronate dehydratase large subunit [Haladaptatus litoreus]|uniref:Altronate dehydratase large subunit n=1 Tax=Haladaptatus litoreus TaxID=553468 RepID=A0A1N7DHV0_9EURY|nr:UxaA family hydrolase [Haladaptatus litoreus]SIR75347.1 altronate dehydratase large subunit [Haladaptatus litoreus]
MCATFRGYRRSDGQIGVRNHVAIIPTSVAASPVARQIATESGTWARATPHQMGTAQPTPARRQTERVLAGVGRNPNVGTAVVLELGTEDIDAESLADRIATSGKPVETLSIQDCGGTKRTLDAGQKLIESLYESVSNARREEADMSELIFGAECGGSDATSGIAANPAVGNAADRLIAAGGTACFSETPEFIGAEHILAERCADEKTRERLLERVEAREGQAKLMGVDLRGAQPTPGNQEGGLTTIEEKSLGAIAKGGTTPIRGIVDYGEKLPSGNGLVLMDTPGYDVESVVAKVAGGAQIIAFTTGRGSTTGNPIAPVIKVTGNPSTWKKMRNNMDVNVSTIVNGEDIEAVGERVYETIKAVADGQRTEAERRQLQEFAINEIQPRELESAV